jgi:hypothetical protein
VHVIIGTLFIAVAFVRLLSYQLTDHHHLGFEAAILYWHKRQLAMQIARQLLTPCWDRPVSNWFMLQTCKIACLL